MMHSTSLKQQSKAAGTVDKASVRTAIENTDLNQMLIMTQNCKIQFSSGVDWHQIKPVTFIEQLAWNSTSNKLESQIVWSPPP